MVSGAEVVRLGEGLQKDGFVRVVGIRTPAITPSGGSRPPGRRAPK